MACNIYLCPANGCGFRCCDFDQGNFIVLFPGEVGAGKDVSHLEIIDRDYHGGQRAICRAGDKSTCDGKYKPIDCIVYPLWFYGRGWLKGSKCPLSVATLSSAGFFRLVGPVVFGFDRKFVRAVEMVGYEGI